ncbi:hypothetical protein GGR50DRAFT_668180 [Xylaria sp. CBS 124048]|nr:hypothetical protein GGR50DRAFT_668180 [Xylaria sp. CBS 124048]
MYSRQWVQMLMVALSIVIATRASWFVRGHEARQLSIPNLPADISNSPESASAASSPSDSPTTATDSAIQPSTSSDSSSSTVETSSTDTPSSTPTTAPTTTSSSTTEPTQPPPSTSSPENTEPTTTAPPSTEAPTSTSSTSTSTGNAAGPVTTGKSTPTTTPKPITKTQTILHTLTDSQGQTTVQSSESVVVSTPGFSGSEGSKSGSGGISAATRSTIIGVTVGVGGAIILAAAGILYWRLHNKRRNQEENEELITYGAGFGGPGTAEKVEPTIPAHARSPFQSTLETYHAPTQANAASNF